MNISQREQAILDVVVEHIKTTHKPYSTLTNHEIATTLGWSAPTTRDKIDSLVKKHYLQRVLNYWTEDGQFYNRVLYKGKLTK